MTETHYRDRLRSLRRILLALVALVIVLSVGLVTVVVTRPHITLLVAIASSAAVLVLVLLALALRIVFRNLPELDQMTTKFDDESNADDARRDNSVV